MRSVGDPGTGVSPVCGDLAWLLLLAVLVSVWALPSVPIGHHGEAREALVVRDIVRHGRWILPRRNGELPSKPPLFHWLAAVPGRFFGVNEVTARLPSVLGGLTTAAVTYLLGVAAAGPWGGRLSVAALLGMAQFYESATEARVDMVFAATVALALGCAAWWLSARSRSARVGVYAATAASVLAKGPAGAVLVVLTLLALAGWERDRTVVTELWSWPLALAAATIAGGWYLLATLQGGMAFVHRQILYENLERLVGEGQFARPHALVRTKIPLGFATRLLPWNLAIPWLAWRGNRDLSSPRLARLLHCWWLVPLLLFTAAAGQRRVYLLPVYPAVAVLAATALVTICPRRALSKLLVGVAVADLILVTAIHATRSSRIARRSLLPFATAVEHVLPEDAVPAAHASCHSTDVLVLAYRLDRRILLARESCAGARWCIAPARSAEALRAEGYTPVLRSRQGTALVLLQRGASSAARSRA